MILKEGQLRKVLADFYNAHQDGKSDNYIADQTGTVSHSTISNLTNQKVDIGIYKVYCILKSLGQSMVSLGYALEMEEARLEAAGPDGINTAAQTLRESSAAYHSSHKDGKSTQTTGRISEKAFPYQLSRQQEKARQEAAEILADAGGRQNASAVLRARINRIEYELLVNQFLQEDLDKLEQQNKG